MSKKMPYTITERGSLPLRLFKGRDRQKLERLLNHPRIAGKSYDDYVLQRAGKNLRAGKYVGVIALGNGAAIEILPKLAKEEQNREAGKTATLRMLNRAFKLDIRIESLAGLARTNDLYEILITLYLRELKKVLRRGLKSAYNAVEDNLPYLKGKLMISEQIKHNAARGERFYVRHDEFTPDRPENRLIKATVNRLLSVSADERNRKELRRCQEMMSEIMPSRNIEQDFAAVVDDRTTVNYRLLMRWSRFFLYGSSFSAFSGSEKVNALLFSVEELFEIYVGETLRKKLRPLGWQVFLQDKRYWLSQNPQMFRLRPDIVARQGSRTVVLDTKWKLLNTERRRNYGIKSEDLYQMLAYARAYKIKDILLLYPKPINFPNEEIPDHFEILDDVNIHIGLIDLCDGKEDDMTELFNQVVLQSKASQTV